MDLSEHISGYENALKYFSNCFTKDLHLKNDDKLNSRIESRFNSYRKRGNCNYNSIIEGIDYIKYLQNSSAIVDKINNIEIKKLYYQYDDVVIEIFKIKKDKHDYLLILSILRGFVLDTLYSMDRLVSCFEFDSRCEIVYNFILKWNLVFDKRDWIYSYEIMDNFLLELRDIGKEIHIINNVNIIDASLEKINNKIKVLKK